MADLKKNVTIALGIESEVKPRKGERGAVEGMKGSHGGGETDASPVLSKSLGELFKGSFAELKNSGDSGKAFSKSMSEIFKGAFAELKNSGDVGKSLKSLITGLGSKLGGSPAMGVLGGQVAGGAGAVAGAAAGPIGIAAVAAVDAIKGIIDEIVSIPDKIAKFVSASNPMQVDRFNLALKDMQGIIGQALEPELEMMTEGIRAIADGLASSDFRDGVREWFSTLKQVFTELKPVISIIVKLTGDMIGAFYRVISLMLRIISIANGIPLIGKIGREVATRMHVKEGASFGQSAQQASFTSLESFGKESIQQTYSMGGAAANHQEQTANNTATMADKLKEAVGFLQNIATGVGGLALKMIGG